MGVFSLRNLGALAITGLSLGLFAVPATAQVYSNNFDGTETFSSGVSGGFTGVTTTDGVQGFAGLGPSGNQFAGNFLHNTTTGNPAASTILTLTNLPAHTSINVGFLLAAIDSWDSTNGSPSPDFFNVTVDSVSVFQTTFANASGSVNYTPPPGGDIGSGPQNRGFGGFSDRAYDMTLEPLLNNIPHTASSLTVAWFASGAGWQGGDDESWAIDNVAISLGGITTAAPEPGSLALLAFAGLPVMGFLRRRRGATISKR